jgi:hypothetical protein
MRRWLLFSVATALFAASPAQADVGATIAATTVHRGGHLRGTGNGSGLPLYLVPERNAPLVYRCHGNGFCAPRTKRPPRPPYVFLGRLRRTRDFYAIQHFRFRVPMVRSGRYKVVMWCLPCGGSLLLAGGTRLGQTVTVLR